jgi:penicillin-binding protein 2
VAFRDIFDEERLRVRILLAVMLAAFGVLLAALWRMQVAHGKNYQRDLMKQSVRRVRVPGMRGQIFDRNGARVADNRPSYCIAVYLEELRQPGRWAKTIGYVNSLLDELSVTLGIPRQVTEDDIKTHVKKRLPMPLLVWRDLDETTMARLAERAAKVPGVDIYVEAVRHYPYTNSACHAIGHVGRADPPKDEEEPYHYYLPEMAGKSGLEKTFDGVLRGEPGGRLVRVDVSGFRHDDLAARSPRNGGDIAMSIDMRAQQLAETALAGLVGAAVIVDPNNGDVLAMASSPGFDLNKFVPAISTEEWKALSDDENNPLMNRAVAGTYAPGSTFKPIVAISAIESKKATPATSFACPGYFMLGRKRIGCWYEAGHGLLDMREALEHSCNVYFFHLGLQCGPEPIFHMSEALGLGQKTDISLDYETPGLLPDNAWKQRMFHDAWRDGDTCNFSIGQGALATTPLQMAMVAAAFANGGALYRPRMVLGVRETDDSQLRVVPPRVVRNLDWSPANIQIVRGGMHDVVMSPRGTGRLAQAPGVDMAGKTGTAEYGKKGSGHKIAWMIAFAPFEHPRYAIALMVEEGVTGGTTAAPKMKEIMTGLFKSTGPQQGEG